MAANKSASLNVYLPTLILFHETPVKLLFKGMELGFDDSYFPDT